MIRMHTITSAAQAKRYYEISDYFTNGVETAGRAGGLLAERLGVGGRELTKEEFGRLCDNLHPLTGGRLTARTNEFRRVGYDMTFSGPKGFSLLKAFAGEADRLALGRAFDEAMLETMTGHVEPETKCRVRVGGADFDRLTGNMIFDRFHHTTSRPVASFAPDPHDHDHVLIWNASHDPVENRIKAVQFGDLKRDAEYFTAVFYSTLAAKVEALGFAVERRGGKEWGIAGISPELEVKFSKRTAEVEHEHEERLKNDPHYRPEGKHELGAKTRSKKNKELTPAELRRDWIGQLSRADKIELEAVYRREAEGGGAVTVREAVAFAIEHCSERLSVIPEKELVRVALLHGLGQITPEAVRAELPRHGVIVAEIDGRAMATTQALKAEERFIVGMSRPGRGVVPVGVPDGLERGTLNDGQWQAVLGLLNSPSRVCTIEGPAGAGKSSLLSAYDAAMRSAGERVTYLATTAKSTEVLQKDGFADATTLARFLVDERMQAAARGGRVVIDETSMLGHADAVRLFKLVEKWDLKIVAVGDKFQHGAVARGAFHTLMGEHAHVRPFRLTEIMRQKDESYRAAAMLLAEGRTVEGFDAIDAKGWVHEIASDAERYGEIAQAYREAIEAKKSVLVVSPTHAEAGKITEAIRAELRAAGRITGKERQFTRLVAANATEAERGQATTYRDGGVIKFVQNAKGFTKGDRLAVADAGGVPLAEARHFQLYREETIALARGDKIRFTAGVKTLDGKHRFTNGQVRSVAGFDRAGNIRLDDGRMIAKTAGHFRHAVVETSFGAQGQTVDRVLLGMAAESTGAMNQEQIYVSATRGRESVAIFTDDKAEIRRSVERSSRKLVALDVVAETPAERVAAKRATLQAERDGRLRAVGLGRVRNAWERSVAAAKAVARAAGWLESSRRAEEVQHGYGR